MKKRKGKTQRMVTSAPAHRRDWRLAWPLITPAIVGFVFFAAYPLVRGAYLSFTSFHESVRPLTLALAVFKQSSPQAAPDWAGLTAATPVAALPMLLLFTVFGRRIVNSIGFTGLK